MDSPQSSRFRKILLPYDFSEHAREALVLACDLAQRYQAQLVLLHVYQPATYFIPPDSVMMAAPEVLARQLSDINSALGEVKKEAEALGVAQVQTSLGQGEPFVEIVREARAGGYDLIVMGTHGRTGLRHVLIGSVAERVVRKAPCPVMTIRHPSHRFEHP